MHLWCCVVGLNLSVKEIFSARQPLYLQFLGWDCDAECRYSCMWKTVRDFQLDGSDIPQFYGKVCFCILESLFIIASYCSIFCAKLLSVCCITYHLLLWFYYHTELFTATLIYYLTNYICVFTCHNTNHILPFCCTKGIFSIKCICIHHDMLVFFSTRLNM